jgi:6-pyruvoyl tetrahydropterin synthase/QueD family protein
MDEGRDKKIATPDKLFRGKTWLREETKMLAKDLNKTKLGNARYFIIQTFHFDASHSLRIEDFQYMSKHALADLRKCFYDHGHTYQLDVEWEGFPTDEKPMIWPFGHLKEFTKTLIDSCDHQNLNKYFTWPTTLENLANWFFKRLQIYNGDNLKIHSVTLREGLNNRVKVEAI